MKAITKTRPILFSAPMVRAILAGKKTQTRRVIKPQPDELTGCEVEWYHPRCVNQSGEEYPGEAVYGVATEDSGWPCPYGRPGDRLWVRETWCHATSVDGEACVYYPADDSALSAWADQGGEGEWIKVGGAVEPIRPLPPKKPSIFMPRWASRITLEVTDVRVERVQDISEADAIAEGTPALCPADIGLTTGWSGVSEADRHPIALFRTLWDKINAERNYSWESNPWVWVVNFRRVEQ